MDREALEVLRAAGRGLGGIVQLGCRGAGARDALRRLVRMRSGRALPPSRIGEIQYGILTGPGGHVDEVLVAWTDHGAELNCHGGTASALAALKLLSEHGFREVGEEAWWRPLAERGEIPWTEYEARRLVPEAATPLQARLVAHGLCFAARVRRLFDLVDEDSRAAHNVLTEWIDAFAPASRILKRHVVAIAGAPNVGKSTCFNALLALDRALVSSLPGTTRDAVRHPARLGGLAVELVDTAGLWDTAKGPDAEAVSRAQKIVREANLCLFLLDGGRPLSDEDRSAWAACARRVDPSAPGPGLLVVAMNKADLPPVLTDEACQDAGIGKADIRFSALGDVEPLRDLLGRRLWAFGTGLVKKNAFRPWEGSIPMGAFTLRQHDLLCEGREHLERGDPKACQRCLARILSGPKGECPQR
ncbi:MAG: GTPase [Planctomycetota bacterium]